MYRHITTLVGKSISTLAIIALVVPGFAYISGQTKIVRADEPETVTVTIDKFIDGEMATTLSASGLSFPMSATWNAINIGAGSGSYDLSSGNTYEAMTTEMSSGADYSTFETVAGDTVGALCSDGKPFALVGYTTGDTFAEASAGTPTLAVPTFTGITSDKFVIVWNEDCSTPNPETVQVTITKYLDGVAATEEATDNASFPMSATWNDEGGYGSGTGSYVLDANSDPIYQAQTVAFDSGADYSTYEVTGGELVGASCETGQPFALAGYTTGGTFEEASEATPSMTAPAFVDMMNDEYVIVWNITCDEDSSGTIGGDVSGGSSDDGSLEVTSVEATDTSAIADGTFGNGWTYTFNITVPDDETYLSMKFANWLHTNTVSIIPAGGNMRISSAQADNGGATVPVTAANTYTSPALHMTGDLSGVLLGKQVQVIVEVAVPVGTVNGAYTTSYGVQTLP